MQVSSINRTNFQGQFQKTPALERILNKADRDALGAFNEIIKRASGVNDGLLFSIKEFPTTCARKTYCLYKQDSFKDTNSIVMGVKSKINDSLGDGAKESDVLGKFLPILEAIYPKHFKVPKENLIADINKTLIG